MFRIGIDARCLSVPITGIGQYTLQLLSRMSLSGGRWYLYSNLKLLPDISFAGNVVVRDGQMTGRAMATLWSQTLLPHQVGRDGIDLFWSPRHHLPLFLDSRIKQVVTIHDLVWRHAPQTMKSTGRLLDFLLMPRSIRKADGVIAVSAATAADIQAELPALPNDRVRVIHEGASCVDPLPREVLDSLGITGKFILFVGTLEPRKNLKRLLVAYRSLEPELQREYPLVIAGGKGWGEDDLAALIVGYGLEDHVVITGYVAGDVLATLYRYAELLVMPSLYEGFGLPLVEAMSFGTPVLTSNCSSMKEVTGEAGVLVDPYDSASIATGIKEVLVDNELRNRLAKKGRERAKIFSWDRAAAETMAFFEEIVRVNLAG